jgi:hypothetical protein
MKEIPFYCPICNCETAVLLENALFATPYLPTLQCTECKQLWRINLYPVGEEE